MGGTFGIGLAIVILWLAEYYQLRFLPPLTYQRTASKGL
jgi:hypothetical protein